MSRLASYLEHDTDCLRYGRLALAQLQRAYGVPGPASVLEAMTASQQGIGQRVTPAGCPSVLMGVIDRPASSHGVKCLALCSACGNGADPLQPCHQQHMLAQRVVAECFVLPAWGALVAEVHV
jgi:hypothetical protein